MFSMENEKHYSAFMGRKLLVSGMLDKVLRALKARFDRGTKTPILVFEDETGKQVDFDLRGALADVLTRYRPAIASIGRGRPKLGVVAREISLLPRHWEWLEEQPNGASAALRRLIDEARTRNPDEQKARTAVHAAGRFLSVMAGNLPGYEEATRALYARDRKRFDELIREWPRDIRLHARQLASAAFFIVSVGAIPNSRA